MYRQLFKLMLNRLYSPISATTSKPNPAPYLCVPNRCQINWVRSSCHVYSQPTEPPTRKSRKSVSEVIDVEVRQSTASGSIRWLIHWLIRCLIHCDNYEPCPCGRICITHLSQFWSQMIVGQVQHLQTPKNIFTVGLSSDLFSRRGKTIEKRINIW